MFKIIYNFITNINFKSNIYFIICLNIIILSYSFSIYNIIIFYKEITKNKIEFLYLFQTIFKYLGIILILNSLFYFIINLRNDKSNNYIKLKLFLIFFCTFVKYNFDIFCIIILCFQYLSAKFFKLNSNIIPFDMIYYFILYTINILFDILFIYSISVSDCDNKFKYKKIIVTSKLLIVSNAIIYILTIIPIYILLGVYQIIILNLKYFDSLGLLQAISIIIVLFSIFIFLLIKIKLLKYN